MFNIYHHVFSLNEVKINHIHRFGSEYINWWQHLNHYNFDRLLAFRGLGVLLDHRLHGFDLNRNKQIYIILLGPCLVGGVNQLLFDFLVNLSLPVCLLVGRAVSLYIDNLKLSLILNDNWNWQFKVLTRLLFKLFLI